MTPQIHRIRDRFNKASHSYDQVAKAQQQAAALLVKAVRQALAKEKPQTILDIGAGTGHLTHLLLSHYPECHFYLNDIAESMLQECRKKFSKEKHMHYLLGDMRALLRDGGDGCLPQYDLIVSNLALQWIEELAKILSLIKNTASQVFGFSTLLAGTFAQWQTMVKRYQPFEPLVYPKAQEMINLCHALKKPGDRFEYFVQDISLSFASALDFMRYLQRLGASASKDAIKKRHLKAMIKAEKKPFSVEYKIFFGVFKNAR